MHTMDRIAERTVRPVGRAGLKGVARVLTRIRGDWVGCAPDPARPRVYFANHRSNADFVMAWTALPSDCRKVTRPVAAADYWEKTGARRLFGRTILNAVLIDRNPETRVHDPVAQMCEALDEAASLIVFPEGSRNQSADELLPFKTGIYHLAVARPDVEFVPVWIDGTGNLMPKGRHVPKPKKCRVTYGAPIRLQRGETKDAFLKRAREALLNLAPTRH